MSEKKQTIGFIGLGDMGEPMASNLIDAGFPVVSCANRRREAIERLAEKGLKEVAGPAEVGARSDMLMTIVFDEAQTDQVLRGPAGAIAHMKPGGIVLVMSTLSPIYCQALAKEAAEKEISVLDCPVSGMRAGAEAGTLSLLIGGEEKAVDACRDALAPLGTVMHCGDVGNGQVVKLGNNAMVIGAVELLYEVQQMVRGYGMDVGDFMKMLNQSTGRSFVTENIRLPKQRPALHAMAKKDLSLARDVAHEHGDAMPIIEGCLKRE